MAVAHDLNLLAEQQRKDSARKFVIETAQRLSQFRKRTAALEAGEFQTWQDARSMAQDIVRGSGSLGLGLLSACAREVQHFADRRFEPGSLPPDLSLYILSALDTLAMELERLQHDQDLR